jgi:hypothetical protein
MKLMRKRRDWKNKNFVEPSGTMRNNTMVYGYRPDVREIRI